MLLSVDKLLNGEKTVIKNPSIESPVHAVWTPGPRGAIDTLLLDIPATAVDNDRSTAASLDAYIGDNFFGEEVIKTGMLTVPAEHQGRGYGRKLVEALAWVALDREVEGIEVEFSHPASWIHFSRVFGSKNIQPYIGQIGSLAQYPTSERIIEVINERRQGATEIVDGQEQVNLGEMVGVKAEVDVSKLDIRLLQPPIVEYRTSNLVRTGL
jgi:GNAT superfamily N-acetyltransferase